MPISTTGQLNQILKETSRAFYLSLAILPEYSRRPLSLGYLLARAADTVADSETTDEAGRRQTLRALQSALLNPSQGMEVDLVAYVPEHEGEQRLLRSVPALYQELEECPETERHSIVGVVHTLIEGMLWDQQLFAQAAAPREEGLSEEELERYTYLVAGCVGPFWSQACAGPDPRTCGLLSQAWTETAIEFGKALQWVNILRDIPKDQLQARFYLPKLERADFTAAFSRGCRRALEAFSSALNYPVQYPAVRLRDRIATFLPLVLGLRTLCKLWQDGGPRQGHRVKVTRTEVMAWMVLSPFLTFFDAGYHMVTARLYQSALSALETWEKNNLS